MDYTAIRLEVLRGCRHLTRTALADLFEGRVTNLAGMTGGGNPAGQESPKNSHFVRLSPENPCVYWVLQPLREIDHVVRGFPLAQEQPTIVQERDRVELGEFIQLLTVRANAALCEQPSRL